MTDEKNNCQYCRYYERDFGDHYVCKRYPKMVSSEILMGVRRFSCDYPEVQAFDWCGEFKEAM